MTCRVRCFFIKQLTIVLIIVARIMPTRSFTNGRQLLRLEFEVFKFYFPKAILLGNGCRAMRMMNVGMCSERLASYLTELQGY